MTKPVIIVMIEDDQGHARLIEKNIRRAGVANEIRHFESGTSGTTYLFDPRRPEGPVLVLLDLNLPDMSGIDILVRLKATEIHKATPVIVLTTTDDRQEIQRCYELGCNVYITKPVDYDAFATAIRQLGLFLAVIQVHRRLYTSTDVEHVEMSDYLSGVLDEMARSLSGSDRPVALRTALTPCRVATDRAVNLGIVATELVTNAFKYAYPLGSAGEVRVTFGPTPDGRGFTLQVSDDGTGFDPTTKRATSGLGRRVVAAMARTLRGGADMETGPEGTTIRLTIPAQPGEGFFA